MRIATIYEVFCSLCGDYLQLTENKIPKELISFDEKVEYCQKTFREKGWRDLAGGALCPHCYKMLREEKDND